MKLFLIIIFLLLAAVANAQAASQSVTNILTWVDNSSNTPAVLGQEDGFIVQRSIGTGAMAEIARILPDVITFAETFPNDIGNVMYCYRLAAFNTAGTSSFTAAVCKTSPVIIIVVVPNAPNGVNLGQKVGPVVP